MRDAFGQYHPIVNFIYFSYVIGISMFFMHPVMLVISAAGAFAYSIYISGRRAVAFNICGALPMMMLFAGMNPLFNHRGITTLFYFRNNPITLESMLYGITAGLMLGSVIVWFSCFNKIMTSDKLVYLFGRLIPSLSLVVSMVLRFVPRFGEQMKRVSEAQKPSAGEDKASVWVRIKRGIGVLSIMLTWALENAVDTADSMNSRGYGLSGRTAFTIYRFERRDVLAVSVVAAAAAFIMFCGFTRRLFIIYFPYISMNGLTYGVCAAYCMHIIICFMPLIIDLWEERRWRHLQSEI